MTSYTRRHYAASVLIVAAVVVLITVQPWWDFAGFPLGALGAWLAMTGPRGRAVVASPATDTPGGAAILGPPVPAWRPVRVATTRAAPPWAASARPAAAWDQWGGFARPPESNPYPDHPSVTAGRWLAGIERVMKGTTTAGTPDPEDLDAWQDDPPFTVVRELEAAALEDDLVMVPTGPLERAGGWVILQPSPRTPPRLYDAPAPVVRVEPPRDPEGLHPPAGRCSRGDLTAALAPTAHPFRYRAATDPPRPGSMSALASAFPAGPGESPCPVCACALEAGGQRCWVCGWLAPALREDMERLAETAEITAIHASAEYAAELEAQDQDAREFIDASERDAFEWASELARELEADRKARNNG